MGAKLKEADRLKQRHEQLALIDEKRLNAMANVIRNAWPGPTTRKVHRQSFEEGDKVLKQIFPMQDEAKGEFAPNWQGPFVVPKVLPGRALD